MLVFVYCLPLYHTSSPHNHNNCDYTFLELTFVFWRLNRPQGFIFMILDNCVLTTRPLPLYPHDSIITPRSLFSPLMSLSSFDFLLLQITEVTQISGHTFSIALSTTAMASFVWLETGQVMGRFSDNGFLLLQPATSVLFYAWQDVTVDILRNSLSVRALLG